MQKVDEAKAALEAALKQDSKNPNAWYMCLFVSSQRHQRIKLSKLKDQQSVVKTNKEYTAILHEIQMAEEQIRNEEDKILEIMEENEQLEKIL